MHSENTLGIYIQVPFCQTKCTYCNFHTGVFAQSLYAPYAAAVCAEIRASGREVELGSIGIPACARLPMHPSANKNASPRPASEVRSTSVAGLTVDTVYLGGGTPSLLEPPALAAILTAVRENFPIAFKEVTLEADPETVTPQKAAAWRAAGINRISMGAQSFNDAELTAAGRIHRRADIIQAVQLLREAGLDNVSLDLIAGLPRQTADSWKQSLEQLLALRPPHLSIYLMEIDEGSRLGREVLSSGNRYSAPALPSDDAMAEFYEAACAALAAEGYHHYEISNWALPGRRAQHNLKYWRRQPYLGFGAGAHSFDGRERWANQHDPAQYVDAIQQRGTAIEQREEVSPHDALEEELFLGLRQLDGIDFARIERQYGAALRPRLEQMRDNGLLEIAGSQVRLAPARLAVSNEVFVELLGVSETAVKM